MILHVPHASRIIPADVRGTLLLDDAELERELTLMTDTWTDGLFPGAAGSGDAAVRSIMVEVRRDLFTDERGGVKLPGFDSFRDALQKVIRALHRTR